MSAGTTRRETDAYLLVHYACGSETFVHQLGHVMGLQHDRYEACAGDGSACSASGTGRLPYEYGYVNQRAFEAGADYDSWWYTVMGLSTQCEQAGLTVCERVMYFSNPALTYAGDPLGVAGDRYTAAVNGPADAVRTLNETSAMVAGFRDRPTPNRAPEAVGTLSDRTLQVQ